MGDRDEEGDQPMQAPPAPPEDLVALGTKIRASTRKRLRHFAIDQEVEMQDVIERALDTYLRAHNY